MSEVQNHEVFAVLQSVAEGGAMDLKCSGKLCAKEDASLIIEANGWKISIIAHMMDMAYVYCAESPSGRVVHCDDWKEEGAENPLGMLDAYQYRKIESLFEKEAYPLGLLSFSQARL